MESPIIKSWISKVNWSKLASSIFQGDIPITTAALQLKSLNLQMLLCLASHVSTSWPHVWLGCFKHLTETAAKQVLAAGFGGPIISPAQLLYPYHIQYAYVYSTL